MKKIRFYKFHHPRNTQGFFTAYKSYQLFLFGVCDNKSSTQYHFKTWGGGGLYIIFNFTKKVHCLNKIGVVSFHLKPTSFLTSFDARKRYDILLKVQALIKMVLRYITQSVNISLQTSIISNLFCCKKQIVTSYRKSKVWFILYIKWF